MVRPVAQRGLFRKLVAGTNREMVAPERKLNIARALKQEIDQVWAQFYGSQNMIRILDVGCGDMGIAEILMQQLPGVEMTCIDTYAPSEQDTGSLKWQKYRQFDGNRLPFPNGYFDIAICVDVLHHAGLPGAEMLLRDMIRTSHFVVVKDHFEASLVSRTLLQLADFYGNWGYGVNIPRRYFRKETWNSAVTKSGLRELRRIDRVQVHGKFLSLILPARLHFVSVLTQV